MMNLATRCATCGTMFRVVQDQLKVSEGWVRCGHCQGVFNALESLFDLDHDLLPVGPPEPPATPAPDDPLRLDTAPPAPLASPAPDDADQIRIAAVAAGSFDAGRAGPPVEPAGSSAAASFGSAPSGLLRERSADAIDPVIDLATERPSFLAEPAPIVRPSPRPYRTPLPARRGLMAALAVLLVLLLGAQALVHERHLAAARWPALRPVLTAGCAAFGCRLELPQSIDEIAVENTGLTRTALAGAFSFSVGLRNRGTLTLAVPSVELSLTDTNGQLVARRVLAAKDFNLAPAAIPPGGEAVLQALLATPASVVSGYTVEAFYP